MVALRWHLPDLFLFFSKIYRESQLEWQCDNLDNTFKCHESNSSFCIRDFQKCDGIANCPNGEDESLSENSECLATYPSLATVKCSKINIYNLNITIKAVPCDGKIECRDDGHGTDESFCSLEDFIEIIIMAAIVVIIMAATIVMIRAIRKKCQPIDRNQTLSKEDFSSLHGTEELKTKMQQIQSCKSSKKINQQFALWKIDQHGGNTNETILSIKVKISIA